MSNHRNTSFFLLILSLSLSCVEMKSTEKESTRLELTASSPIDTLSFRSGIRVIFQDRNGNYWFGSHNEGLGCYNGKSFQYFTTKDGLADNQIRSIQEDDEGNIWIGTTQGASVYHNGTFTNYFTHSNEPIYDWLQSAGDLWFGAGNERGINRFDGKNLNFLIFPRLRNENPNNSYGVTDISTENNGNTWIATYAALFAYDGQTISTFDEDRLQLSNKDVLHIRSVLADSKGRVWIGNNGIGVLLMEGNVTTHFSEQHHLIDPSSKRRGDPSKPGTLEHVFAIEEDSEGHIWFGDRDTGPWKYDDSTLTHYPMTNNPSKAMIWTIYRDQKNQLLFGMEDGNVWAFNGKTFEKKF